MPASLEILAVHGWGFAGHSWRPWSKVLPGHVTLKANDRGYFGNPRSVSWSSGANASRALFVHSMGLLLCDEGLLEQADAIVLFGCFEYFHPAGQRSERHSRRILSQMRMRVKHDPKEVLKAFYENCGLAAGLGSLSSEFINSELLERDLVKLDNERISLERVARISRILVVHGKCDQIVPPEKGAKLKSSLGPRAIHYQVEDAGHGLPFTHASGVWQRIRNQLNSQV